MMMMIKRVKRVEGELVCLLNLEVCVRQERYIDLFMIYDILSQLSSIYSFTLEGIHWSCKLHAAILTKLIFYFVSLPIKKEKNCSLRLIVLKACHIA